MIATAPAWEQTLLERAYQALQRSEPMPVVAAGPADLEQAYRRCAEITAQHSRTFFLSSGLLPAAKRRAARALYAFCRVSDELVDRPGKDAHQALAAWREMVLNPTSTSDPVVMAWADTRRRYAIPQGYVEQLLDGVALDLQRTRYQTFAALAEYCYGVACTVGLMTMHIVGFAGQAAVPYALKLGLALQLTNILRDVGEDWRAGRLYLPQDELAHFGVTEDDIAGGRLHDRWRAFLGFQIERTRRFYHQAWPGIALLRRDGRFAIAAAGRLYSAILDDIVAHGGDVFRRRAHVSALGKLRRLPAIWWDVQRLPGLGEPPINTDGH